MKKSFTLILSLLIFAGGHAQLRYLKASLLGSGEVPPVSTTATGVVIVKFNTATNLVELEGVYSGLSSTINGSHIHQAPAGVNGPVIVSLANSGGTTGTLSGSGTLTAGQAADLLAGNMYVNVHSANNGGGEIRGQLSLTTEGQTSLFNVRLQGAQEVPPNPSTASGFANVLLDKTKDSVYVAGSFSGLSANATASHIHIAPAGSNGPVIVPLSTTVATDGVLLIAASLSSTDKTSIVNGNGYINVHTSTYPGGEIRGQINQLAQMRFFGGQLQGSQEVPPNASPGMGTIIAKYDTATKLLEVMGDYQNLTTAVNASHIHSPATPGVNAGVLFNLTNTGGTSGTLTGSATLTPSQEADLYNGLMYANVHTPTYSGGEIRAQLVTTSGGQTEYMRGTLQGSQEEQANASAGTGSVTIILDRATNKLFLTGSFSGLTANATAAHIHRGLPGTSGPVVVTLSATPATAGTVTGSATVSSAFADSLINGFTYVNIHNATYPAGELRAQLGNQTLPVVLSSFDGFAEGDQVTLVWQVSQEINLSHYEIEQLDSESGRWIRKAIVQSRGEKGSVVYKHTDYALRSNGQEALYRLKIVDNDGKFTYSLLVRVALKLGKERLVLLGNPVPGKLRFVITGFPANEKAEVKIVDLAGRILKHSNAVPGRTEAINVENLAPGRYIISVRVKGQTLNQAFIR